MRVFILGAEAIRSLGFAIAQRLLMEGHTVTALATTDMGVQNLNKGKIRTVSGDFEDADVQKQLVKAEAVIDSEFVIRHTAAEVAQRRSLLIRELKGTERPLIVASSAYVLGDTGPVPVVEHTPRFRLFGAT